MEFTKKRGLLVLSSAMLIAIAGGSYIHIRPLPNLIAGDKPSPTSLVSFADEAAKQKFIAKNDLDENDLNKTQNLDDTYIVDVPNNKLKTQDGVTVAPRREYRALVTPNDTIYPQWYTTSISAPSAWDITTGPSTVGVAVVDTGFGLSHEDMANRWAINSGEFGAGKQTNGIDDDSNGRVDDWRGWDFLNDDNDPSAGISDPNGIAVSHGTTTAGLVGATGNNATGVASVNWGAPILPLQILSDNGSGFTEDLAAAINYATARGVKVISLSLGSTGTDPIVQTAINNAISSGVTVIAAAGNCGDPASYFINGCDYPSQMLYPARYSNVIAVGATDQNDNRASFSSYGAELDIVAPGSGSIRAPGWQQGNQTSYYTTSASGTSFATPIVAGVAALLHAQEDQVTPAQVMTTLLSVADKVAQMGSEYRTDQHGFGRLNAFRSLRYVTAAHPDGTLIYNANRTGVVLIDNGTRRNITSGSVFDSYGYHWSGIEEPTVGDANLPVGSDLSTHREGALLHAGGGLYVVNITDGGVAEKRPFYSWNAFTGLGYNLNETINISASELPSQTGTPITDATQHPDGTLIYNANRTGVQIIEAGQTRNIVSGSVFSTNSFSWNKVKNPTATDLTLVAGSNMSYQREGTLVLAGGGIYAIDYTGGTAQKRAIGSWDTFVGFGYTLNQVISISVSELPSQNGTILIY